MDGVCVCVCECVCVCQGWGPGGVLPYYGDMLVLDLLEREDVT